MNTEQRFWSKVDIRGPDECWPWTRSRNRDGYGTFGFLHSIERAHRVAWWLTHSNPGKLHVLHKCDNTGCCNPGHLFLGTHADNLKDVTMKGRLAGELRPFAKLTWDQVAEIRRLYAEGGTSYYKLAVQFGVCKTTIESIIKETAWRKR